jgi:hypothetical protein
MYPVRIPRLEDFSATKVFTSLPENANGDVSENFDPSSELMRVMVREYFTISYNSLLHSLEANARIVPLSSRASLFILSSPSIQYNLSIFTV